MLGLLLVLASTAGTVWLVGSLDRGVEVYAARDGFAVGQRVEAARLERVTVRLANLEDKYLPVSEALPEGAIATTFVGKGELVPRSSVGSVTALNRKPVPIPVDGVLPEQLHEGAHADLWVAVPDERNGFKEPRLLVPAAEVVNVVQNQQAFGASASQVVILLIPDAQMPQVLAAQLNKARVSVVWNPSGRAT